MNRKKIVIVGGGSYTWAPTIVKDVLLKEALQESEFMLYDINKEASDMVKAFLDKVNRVLRTKASIVSTDSRSEAFKDADYFVITISTGGLASMAHDLSIPEEYGVFHTVGDTSGPGGWARTIRNFEVFSSLARDINSYAPGAVVLNYTNPMTTLTAVLSGICKGPVIGLCHDIFENIRFIKSYYKLKDESEISMKYAGLNHFFWCTEVKAKGIDVFADLKERVAKVGFTALLKEANRDRMGHTSNKELATALFNETQVMPYLGDRHTCEFFSCYITNKKAMERFKLVRTTIEDRQKGFEQRAKNLENMIDNGIPDEYFKSSTETAADIISTHIEGRSLVTLGNVMNIGQVSNLPLGSVVETDVRVDGNGFSPIAFGPLPESVLGFVEPHVHVFNLTLESCLQSDKEMALRALRLDPVCSHLTGEEVRKMGEWLIRAHRSFINIF